MAVQKVKRRGRTVWRARVVRNGVERTAFRSRMDEAQEAERELLASFEDEPAKEEKTPTVAEFAERWLEHQATRNKPGEIMRKRDALRLHILPHFGELRLDEVNAKAVDRWKVEKLRTLKPATVAAQVTVLKRMLRVAVHWELIDRMPAIDQVQVPNEEVYFLDFDEADAFLNAAGEWRTFFLIAIRTGLRVGELRALKWADIDLERKRIRVSRSYTRAGMGVPKSGKARTVYLTWDAAEALEQVKRPRGFVFGTSSNNPKQYKTIYEACVRTSRAAKLGRVASPHVLRHTFGAHHAMRGTDMLRLKQWMGHADIRTTLRYAHLSEAARTECVDNIAPSAVGPQLGPKGRARG